MTQPNEPAEPPIEGPYRFMGLVATSGRFYAARFRPLFLLFFSLYAVVLATSLIPLEGLSSSAELAGRIFLQFVLSTMVISYGYALVALIAEEHLRDRSIGVFDAMRMLRPNLRHVISCALTAGIIAMTAVFVFALLGVILLPLFYGPPMLLQVVVIEKLSLNDGWARTRALMRGHWLRVISYLMSIGLGVGLLSAAAVSATVAATDGGAIIGSAVLIFVALIAAAATYPFLGVAQYIAYADIASLEQYRVDTKQRAPGSRTKTEKPVIEAGVSEPTGPQTHYDILGVRKSATQKQIRRAYDVRMRLLDPERHTDLDDGSREQLESSRARATEAFDTLSDPGTRRVYDATLQP